MTTGHDTDAKLALQQRSQLSALVDGDLAPEQARFLLRRLGHDTELAGRWQRWHLIGDVLRGRPVASFVDGDDGFAARVAGAVAAEGPATQVRVRPRWQRGVGLAAAASVAALALFVARPLSVDTGVPGDDAGLVAAGAAIDAPADRPAVAATPVATVPQFVEATPAPAATVAQPPPRNQRVATIQPPPVVDAAPERVVADPASIASASRTPATAIDPIPRVVVASADERPFARPLADADEPQARPWPRAVLPAPPGGDQFTVGFGAAPAAPTFYPFEPRLPEAGEPATSNERNP